MPVIRLGSRLSFVLLGVVLALWVGWLRLPTFAVPLWNVDEAIHAGVARTLLDGGVIYRDAVDQRTPLSYYAFAAMFRIAGVNNLYAVRVAIAVMIAATALCLFALGRSSKGIISGGCAALTFVALACYLLSPDDAYAAHTEWFVALFTTCAALVFWSGTTVPPGLLRCSAVGSLCGLAFLSKQPALLDVAAPAGTLVYVALMRLADWRVVLRSFTGLALGFVAVVGITCAALWFANAGPDFLFYAWTYNLKYYGPEVDSAHRVFSGVPFFAHLARTYPLVMISGVCALLAVSVRVVQLKPNVSLGRSRAGECYMLLWCVSSLAGALSSGRGFDHYFIQFLPAFSWLASWLPDTLGGALVRGRAGPARRGLVALLLAFFFGCLVFTPLAARRVPPPPVDPARPVAEYIDQHSQPSDKIFVWGYNPDIYLYANRAPASRFLYCTFQTGLIPWTNLDPEKDTRYAIVPGAMDTLIGDLRHTQPLFVVDCGVGPHRHFDKYPLADFEPLRQLVAESYVEIDPAEFRPRGFRLFMRRDTRPTAPAEIQPGQSIKGSSQWPAPTVSASSVTNTGPSLFSVSAESGSPSLQRLALLVDGTEASAVTFKPSRRMKFVAELPLSNAGEEHQLTARAGWVDGSFSTSAPLRVLVSDFGASDAQRIEFALPFATRQAQATGVRALLNPNADHTAGQRVFNMHAPSLLRYSLPPNVKTIRGHFGILAGAYAPENKAPTDGADFLVKLTDSQGEQRTVFERLLNPAREAADRATQSFQINLDHPRPGMTLEFEISSGPNGSASSDWTYWSDLMLEATP